MERSQESRVGTWGSGGPRGPEGPGESMNALKFSPTTVSVELGGTPISIETGRIAKLMIGWLLIFNYLIGIFLNFTDLNRTSRSTD